MEFEVVKLYFDRSLHAGTLGIGVEKSEKILHSDRIFSAVCNAWAILYGRNEVENLIRNYQTNPPFIMSSAFPFVGEKLFFPKPYLKLRDFDKLSTKQQENIEKAEFAPREIFLQWINFEEVKPKIAEDSRIDQELQEKIGTLTLSGNRKNRSTGDTEPFFRTNTMFKEDAGLYFLVKFNEEHIKEKLAQTLNFLGDEGIGGERALGCGRFRPSLWKEKINIENKEYTNGWCTLSLYYPSDKEMDKLQQNAMSYELVQRGGWIDSPYIYGGHRKARCRMFKEGSIFLEEVKGKLVDVSPDGGLPHSIWRYGLAFLVPCVVPS